MNEKETFQKKSEWLKSVNKSTVLNQSGAFLANDKFGRQVILEWIKTDMLSQYYLATMRSISKIALQAYTLIEMTFLKAYPEVVGYDAYFKPFEPLFKNGLKNVNWKLVEERMQENLRSFFISDSSNFSNEIRDVLANVVHIFVAVRDKKTGKQLGFITFLITPEYNYGDLKCITFAVLPEEQNRGLGKLLMCSILKIIPQIKRIFLCTRVTNEKAQVAYQNWGFSRDLNPVKEEHRYTFNLRHWIFLEYKVDQSDALQEKAVTLTDLSYAI